MITTKPLTEFGRFFLPGPTDVRPQVLEQMLKPMIGHRVPEMEQLMGRIQPNLKYLFQTERPVYVSASSATGLMEGAVRNAARERVLCLVNGAFSERFFHITRANGLKADPLEVGWGEAHTPEMLADALRRGDYDAVTVVHSETSTGVLNPVRELAEVTRQAGDVVLLVDGVSSLGGAQLLTDAWGLDFVLTGSQKAIALPPGLAFGAAQPHILERAKEKTNRGIYFDFLEFERNLATNQTPNTPAVSLLFAAAYQLDDIRKEGYEARLKRHMAMAKQTYAWVDRMNAKGVGVEILAPEKYRSPTVSTVRVPRGWTGPKVAAGVKARGFAVATGYGKLKDETFRIGHMGDHTVGGLDALLEALEDLFA